MKGKDDIRYFLKLQIQLYSIENVIIIIYVKNPKHSLIKIQNPATSGKIRKNKNPLIFPGTDPAAGSERVFFAKKRFFANKWSKIDNKTLPC